jgi:hypothetical protein
VLLRASFQSTHICSSVRARFDPRCLTRSLRLTVATCPGSLIVHGDGTVAGCTNDDDADACRGLELRHEGDPTACTDWWDGGNYCGVHGAG